jgi:hypothetical protein
MIFLYFVETPNTQVNMKFRGALFHVYSLLALKSCQV